MCRTDLHVRDGELPNLRYPITPGHEIVGRVVARGSRVTALAVEWPSGARDLVTGIAADQLVTIREGQGVVARTPGRR